MQRLRELLEKNCHAEFLQNGLVDVLAPAGRWKRAEARGVNSFEYQ